MSEPIDNKLIDKRVVHRYLEKGRVHETDYEQYLKKLPDLTDQAVAIESEIEDQDLGDSEDKE